MSASKTVLVPKSKNALEAQNHFTISAMSSLFRSSFGEGFGKRERLAAIRAILRHGAHVDGAHFHMKTPAGLHPAYIGFTPPIPSEELVQCRTDFVEESLNDIFDVVRSIFALGISILIRCPGYDLRPKLTVEKIAVDVYITPHELSWNERVNGDTAMLVQAFCEEFAIPHMSRFVERCNVESLESPLKSQSTYILQAATPVNLRHLSHSAAIRKATNMGAPSRALFHQNQHQATPDLSLAAEFMSQAVRQRRLAEAFLLSADTQAPTTNAHGPSAPGSVLISIGPKTDATLDQFGLGDDLLPHLPTNLSCALRTDLTDPILLAAVVCFF
ncbi:hypothetical protein L210DRAFT_962285 [Boletus edulis BED1]|uniref:Uncharacterized protein n=1 Tax=Boletus edulis BED1 TaxID=1328754 RepID=A0AAD4CAM7_BOLED|nr:hypothetical protein L210DRAFT_962285 [Boletus edulis BED1]